MSITAPRLNHLPRSLPPRRLAPCRVSKAPIIPTEVLDCYVYESTTQVKGICHFIGGAFGGAIPQIVYPGLLSELAYNGYSTIATPFPFTFKHKERSENLRQTFEEVLATARETSLADRLPRDVPVHGIGHSFGALAHSLIGCSSPEIASNVLMSFNNKEVESAIPIPGFIPAVRVAFQLYDQSPVKLLQSPVPLVKEVARNLINTAKVDDSLTGLVRRTVNDTFDQIDSCFEEIRQGVVDFDPVPKASAQMIQNGYNVPNTLLVQFTEDNIDETPYLLDIMKNGNNQSPIFQKLKGSHLTPCVGDLRWLSGLFDVKLDEEVVEFVQKEAQSETEELVKMMVDWLDRNS